jgi:NAD-dependent dihydropyrimidine dehydrogenase PreA subunit
MIELVLSDRCTGCGTCVTVCPTNVFDLDDDGRARIARLEDCQTCFMCELYCEADALYVGPDCNGARTIDTATARLFAGQFRRESGWHEWAGDPRYANEHWRMDEIFARARGESGVA